MGKLLSNSTVCYRGIIYERRVNQCSQLYCCLILRNFHSHPNLWASHAAQWERICLPMQEMWEMRVWSLGREDPQKEEMANYSLAWEILWTEEPGGLQSMGWQRARQDWATEHTHTEPTHQQPPPWSVSSISSQVRTFISKGLWFVEGSEDG